VECPDAETAVGTQQERVAEQQTLFGE